MSLATLRMPISSRFTALHSSPSRCEPCPLHVCTQPGLDSRPVSRTRNGTYWFTHPDLVICFLLHVSGTWRFLGVLASLCQCRGDWMEASSFSHSASRLPRGALSTCAPASIYYYSSKLPSPAWHLGPHICTEKEPGGRLTIVWLSLSAAHSNDFGLCCFCTVISRWQALTATFSPPISGENIGIWVHRLNIQTKALRGPLRLTCHLLGFARLQQALGMR